MEEISPLIGWIFFVEGVLVGAVIALFLAMKKNRRDFSHLLDEVRNSLDRYRGEQVVRERVRSIRDNQPPPAVAPPLKRTPDEEEYIKFRQQSEKYLNEISKPKPKEKIKPKRRIEIDGRENETVAYGDTRKEDSA